MTAAIFGLLGVVAGGLITFTTQIVMLRRQERGRARAAARVVSAELTRIQAVLTLPTFGPAQARLGVDEALAVWDQYRADLALLPDWEATAAALISLAAVAPLTTDAPVPTDPSGHLQGLISNAIRELEVTCEPLEPGISGALWQWLRRPDHFWIRTRRRLIRRLTRRPRRSVEAHAQRLSEQPATEADEDAAR